MDFLTNFLGSNYGQLLMMAAGMYLQYRYPGVGNKAAEALTMILAALKPPVPPVPPVQS